MSCPAQMQVQAEIESLVSPTPNIMVDGISRAPISAQYGAGPHPAATPPPPSGGAGGGGWGDQPSYRPDMGYGGGGGYVYSGQGQGYSQGQDSRPTRGLDAVKPAWMTQSIGGDRIDAGAASEAASRDPSHFHDFWQYASYYGENAARAYYLQWSPPAGSRPPPGMIIPPDSNDGRTGPITGSGAEDMASKEAWERYEREMEEWNRLYGDGSGGSSVGSGSVSNGYGHAPDDQHSSKRGRY